MKPLSLKHLLSKHILTPIIFTLITLLNTINCFSQSDSSILSSKNSTPTNIIFFENFDDNKNNWTVGDNKHMRAKIDGGLYYLTATGHAYGEAQEIKIDSRQDFEIETSIKIVSGNAEHKNYYSMVFWGREEMNSYYFTFAKDGFVSVESCDGKNQTDCVRSSKSLQKTMLNPNDFNTYKIRKKGNMYTFFVNGEEVYKMPFTPFFGNLIGFGAGRKVMLAVDYLKVSYSSISK